MIKLSPEDQQVYESVLKGLEFWNTWIWTRIPPYEGWDPKIGPSYETLLKMKFQLEGRPTDMTNHVTNWTPKNNKDLDDLMNDLSDLSDSNERADEFDNTDAHNIVDIIKSQG